MTFGFGFGYPRRVGAGGFSPASLFAAGEVGAWYDPSDLTTLFLDTTGNTAITTPGQTVAVMVDKSKPYVLVTSLPTMACSASVTQSGNVLTFNNSLAGDQASGSGISGTGFYAMTFTVAGTGSVAVYIGAGPVTFSAGTHTLKTWYAASAVFFIFRANAGGFNGTVTFTERRDYLGNHATQATVAARPTYRVDAGGRSYLEFDGVDDSMATGTLTSSVDKVQLFVGVRKLSDVTTGVIAENSIGSGTYLASAPRTSGLGNYGFRSGGTLRPDATSPSTYAAPITNVLTGLGDISGDTVILRLNAVQAALNSADQGTGNISATPLYIGARDGTSTYLNGHIYGLIVRYSSTNLDAGAIASTESWMNGKTGAY